MYNTESIKEIDLIIVCKQKVSYMQYILYYIFTVGEVSGEIGFFTIYIFDGISFLFLDSPIFSFPALHFLYTYNSF